MILWDVFYFYQETSAAEFLDAYSSVVAGISVALIVLPEYVGLYLYGYRERRQWRDAADNRNLFADLARNAWAGLKLLFFGRVSAAQFRPGMASVLAGFVAVVVVIGLFGYYREPGDVYFDATGATVLGSIFFVVVLLAMLLCTARRQLTELPLLLTALLSAAPLYLVALYGLMHYAWDVDIHPVVWPLLGCWGLLVVVRALAVTFGRPRLGEVVLVVAAAGLFTSAALSQYLRPNLFYTFDDEDSVAYDGIDQEDVFYRQPALVASKVGDLAAQTPGEADLYFLGFAGNGEQTLFRREVRFAQDLMERNFDTGNRSLSLVNDLENLATEPLANRHNLRQALQGIGRVMDVENDVLFLFLTSHGGKNADLEVSLYPLELQGLQGHQLRQYLDESGIQWRVIVISACYSGSFIDLLEDEQTLVMTAASADATSFGCSDERELTYFGEALFKDALAGERDLAVAFTAAKASIAAREAQEGIDPSHPQMVMGERIAVKLRSMGLVAGD